MRLYTEKQEKVWKKKGHRNKASSCVNIHNLVPDEWDGAIYDHLDDLTDCQWTTLAISSQGREEPSPRPIRKTHRQTDSCASIRKGSCRSRTG